MRFDLPSLVSTMQLPTYSQILIHFHRWSDTMCACIDEVCPQLRPKCASKRTGATCLGAYCNRLWLDIVFSIWGFITLCKSPGFKVPYIDKYSHKPSNTALPGLGMTSNENKCIFITTSKWQKFLSLLDFVRLISVEKFFQNIY